MITLIPPPKHLTETKGTERTVPYLLKCTREEWNIHADAFCETFEKGYSRALTKGEGGVELIYDSAMAPNAYRISTDVGLRVYAGATEGLCYGLATALQLCDPKDDGIHLPLLEIEDRPDKDYRSVLVDLGREWHPFDKLLKYVDLCFFYKIRYLNLHFADNKLYTLPSKAFPKLCAEGKYYTEEQILHLRKYAAARGIILVPEFECPGHAPILNTFYPEVFADRSEGEGGVFYNEEGEVIDNKSLLCAGSEQSVEGVKTLLKEISDLFPETPYLHIGGDEANISLWDQCSECKAYMKEHGINGVYGLYSDYVARIASYVLSLGKTPIVWEGFPEEGANKIPPETVVISWENHYQTTQQILAEGFPIINASWKPLYIVPGLTVPSADINWGTREILDWNVYNWQHWWPHSTAHLNPVNIQPTDQVLGAMLCVWEMSFEQEINLVMAHLAAMSERVWAVERTRSYETFREHFKRIYKIASRIIQDR